MDNPSSKALSSENGRAEIVSKAVCKAADFWEINNQLLAEVLGLSNPTISRLRRKQYVLSKSGKEWELAMLFLRAFRGLDAYMGGDVENEKIWIHAPNDALNGIPIDLMRSVEGLAHVVQYIDCVRGR